MAERGGRRRRRSLAAAVVVLLAVALFAAQRGDDDGGRRRLPLSPTTTRADLSGVELYSLEGTTTSAVLAPGEGKVAFRGVVRNAAGQTIPGATVRAEWGVPTDPPTVVDVFTDDAGQYEITGVYGGRWRIRAWRTPDFATAKTEDLFVNDDEQRQLDLGVEAAEGYTVTWDVEPDPPITGHNTRLLVVFVDRTVDEEGRLVTTPLRRLPVTLVGSGAWERVDGGETQLTDGDGRVEWILRCARDGRQDLGVDSEVRFDPLEIAACIPITATSTTSTIPPSTTTTTASEGD